MTKRRCNQWLIRIISVCLNSILVDNTQIPRKDPEL
jgi:hypothetical protein